MTARTTYEAAVVSAVSTYAATVAKAEMTRQEAINVVGVNAGANPQLGASDSQITAIKAANLAKAVTLNKAEHDKQVAINNARSTLQATGDVGAG